MSILKRVATAASDVVVKEARAAQGREIAAQVSRAVAGEVAAKTTAREATRQAAKTLGRDVLVTTTRESVSKTGSRVARGAAKDVVGVAAKDVTKVASKDAASVTAKDAGKVIAQELEDTASPAFAAAMKIVKDKRKVDGLYVDVSKELLEAISKAETTKEALTATRLAQELSLSFNKANRPAVLAGLDQAITKAAIPEEAFDALAQVVKSRQEAYALFRLTEKRAVLDRAAERYLTVGGEPAQDLAMKAFRLAKARFDQNSANSTAKRIGRMEVLADQVRTLANWLHKAIS